MPVKAARKRPRRAVPEKARTRLELDERRAQLIMLGFDMFASHPYDEVHVGELARAAGISKGLLYHYFPTKRDFYTATLRTAAEKLLGETEINPTLPPGERLADVLDRYLNFVERYATAYVTLMRGGVGSDPQVGAIIEETRRAYTERLSTGLAQVFSLPALSMLPLLRTAMRGWIGFVEATSLDWAVARDVPRATLINLLVQTLLATLEAAGTILV